MDWNKTYCNKTFKQIFDDIEVKYECTNIDTLQINEVPERINRTLLDLVRCLKMPNYPKDFGQKS